jgi:hypothetical protein
MRLIAFVAFAVVTLVSKGSAFGPAIRNPRRCSFLLKSKDSDIDNARNNLGRELRGLQLKKKVEAGDTVICKRDLSSAGIFENRGYELRSIYAQRFNPQTQQMERITLENLDARIPEGYDRYVTLFSPLYHKEPVVVTPEEVGLVSVRSELLGSMWLAVPGVFWVFVCFNIYNIYHERTGGNFADAFWGR